MTRAMTGVVSAAVVEVVAVLVIAAAALGPAQVVGAAEVPAASLAFASIALGAIVVRAVPRSPVGPALAWSTASTSAVRAVEVWGLTAGSPAPWWGSGVAGFVGPGFWPWQLMGFFALVLVFPDGLLPGRWWRALAVLGPVAALLINVAKAGTDPADMPAGWRGPLLVVGLGLLLIALGGAVGGVTASRARVVAGITDERRRLQRDLHDGAQQHVLAVGMRLRSLQGRLLAGETGAGEISAGHMSPEEVRAELDRVVAAIEGTVAELRRIAHGVRPSRLDDGLAAALGDLALDSPVPLDVDVADLPDDLDDTTVTTAYFVVAEAVANAWKHARADRVGVAVGRCAGRLRLVVSDDGRGGVDPSDLTALQDRVLSVGGHLDVASPPGAGTRITAVI